MRCSVYIVHPAVLSCSDLKLHQTFEVKNIFKQEKIMLQLKFNPGLTLPGFRTTRPLIVWLFLYHFFNMANEANDETNHANEQYPVFFLAHFMKID